LIGKGLLMLRRFGSCEPLSHPAGAGLLQAPSGHAWKGCWPGRRGMRRCSRSRFSW